MSVTATAPSRRDAQAAQIKPRVLIVEDETALVELLRYNLEQAGFSVSVAYDGEEALAVVQEDVPDLVLLDWMLPLMSGIEVCRQLRRQTATANLPIIMLTARGEEGDRVRGLDAGADDYVAKPFRMAELLARARALQRRRIPALMDIGGVRVETGSRRVEVDGVEIALSNKEFELLRVMMSRAGQVVTREEILSEVWNDPSMKTSKTLDMHMSWLRRKLAGQDSGTAAVADQRISTVRGVGFRFETD